MVETKGNHDSPLPKNKTTIPIEKTGIIRSPKRRRHATPRLKPVHTHSSPFIHTSSTSFGTPVPPAGPFPNMRPAGVPSHSSGTPTRQPSRLLTHRASVGSGFSASCCCSSSGWGTEPSATSAAETLPRRLGACFLRSLFIVSICAM